MQEPVYVSKSESGLGQLQLSSAQAAEALRVFYRDNKVQLHSRAKAHKDVLLAQLMAGVPVAHAFAPFLLPPEPVKPVCPARAA